jgi:hypothetical protein
MNTRTKLQLKFCLLPVLLKIYLQMSVRFNLANYRFSSDVTI